MAAGAHKTEHDRAHRGASGPHAFWSGTLTFGLVSVPVDLFPAIRSRRVPLKMVGPAGQALARRYFCPADGRELGRDEIVRGYERPDGGFTVVSDEELDALAPRKSREIDLTRFVPRGEIPPELLERPYVLTPSGDSDKAYRLLAATMEDSGRAGIATFVMRGKEYLAAIFAERGLLRAVTLRFVEELRTPDDVGLPNVRRAPAKNCKAFAAVLERLAKDDVDTGALRDEHSAALLELAERKRAESRDVIEIEEEAPPDSDTESADVVDIMSVLRERLGGARAPARPSSPARQPTKERRAASKSAHGSTRRSRSKAGRSRKK